MADINIQEVTNHINIETANGYNLEFNGPVVNMNVVLSNYYTKTETDALLNDKADKADTYTISQINDMVQDINTAVDTKQNLITGAASTITNSNLTTNRAVISNASGKVAVSNVTSTELGYLSGVTSGIQTQLNNKASTSLDNLTADGQMIIDSQNGTISNCILEIPQNIKVTLENNVLTLKAGSILTIPASVYTTVTTTQDFTHDYTGYSDGRYVVVTKASGRDILEKLIENCVSGAGATTTSGLAYDTTANEIGYYLADGTKTQICTYPFCIIDILNGVASFAKDSNGNDMIFNGAGFIGHHAFIYPNVKGLRAFGFNEDKTLKSQLQKTTALQLYELPNNRPETYLYLAPANDLVMGAPVAMGYPKYVAKENWCYCNTSSIASFLPIVSFATDSNRIVTDFAIRQPYQGARNLLTDDLYKQIGDVETLLATV